ncbi:MAG: pyridoxal kinase PdxY [Propionibacteriaceae bacterium]|nr:pyridoxal kinase PdxY [Propionibacteriaceae bacterium]
MRTILSIQSSVAYGHVGNSAATFPLMRSGVQVWPVLTVHFSNHTGYGAWRGPLLSADDVFEVITGIDERGVLGEVDAVLSGYQGAADVGAQILAAYDLVRQRNLDAIYCCDPVIGDVDRGVYVRPGIGEFMRDSVVPRANIVTPNHFELDYLCGTATKTMSAVVDAANQLRKVGPEVVLVTSVQLADSNPDTLTMIVVDADGAWRVETPLIGRNFTGSGDLTAALFLANYLASNHTSQAMQKTTDSVYSLLKFTADTDSRELALVEGQAEIVNPSYHFEVERI